MENPDAVVISAMIEFSKNFIEKPHPAFSDLPICPFGHKTRLENKILYQVYRFPTAKDLNLDSKLIEMLRDFGQQNHYEILLVIHPDQQAFTLEQLQQLIKSLNQVISKNLVVFGGHPADPFNIQGVYTRQAPYPHFVVQNYQLLKRASDSLLNTDYYKHWTSENFQAIGFPRQ